MEEIETDELSNFLSQLGLDGEAEVLKKEEVTMEILKKMSAQDLKTIGIPYGKSFKITKALEKSLSTPSNEESWQENTKEVESSSEMESEVDVSFASPTNLSTEEECSTKESKKIDKECILRLVLLGKTGAGKSATANTILGKQFFKASSSSSSTKDGCSTEIVYRFNRKIQIIDTPGLFDTSLENEDVQNEIVRCIAMSSPGPHAFILVLNTARFTKEEEESFISFVKLFGESIYEYFIILFTRKDDLDFEGKSLDDYLSSAPASLKSLVENCGRRCVAFNNRETDLKTLDKQVKILLQLIDDNICKKSVKYYTDKMFEEAERKMEEFENEIKQTLEEKRKEKYTVLRKEIDEKYNEKENKMKLQLNEIEDKISLAKNTLQEKEEQVDEVLKKLCEEKASLKTYSEEVSAKKNNEIAILQDNIQQEEKEDNGNLREIAVGEISSKKKIASIVAQKFSDVFDGVKGFFSKKSHKKIKEK